MLIVRSDNVRLPSAFLHFEAQPQPRGLVLLIRDGRPGELGSVTELHLSKTEGLALLGQLAPAVVSAGADDQYLD